jgi:integrase
MLKQRNGWWHVHIPIRGKKPIRCATGFKVEGPKPPPEAKEYHDKLANESWRVHRLGEKPKRKWEEAVVRWEKEMRERKRSLGDDLDKFAWLHSWLGGKTLDEITRDLWSQILEAKRLDGVADSTLNRYTALISAVMRKAEREWEWIDRAPFYKRFPEPEPRDRWLTPEEAEGIVQKLPEWAADPFLFDLATGLRCGNLLGLKWSWIKNNAVEIPAEAFKQKRKHPVPLTPFARSLLTRQIGKHTEFVFTVDGKPIAYHQWRWHWEKARPEGVQFRDVRRTWATWLRDFEVDERNVQDAGGWSTTEMLRRVYAVANASKLASEIAKLDPVLTRIKHNAAESKYTTAA